MRKTIFSCAFLLSVSAACAVASVGCSGDDSTDEPGDSGSTTDAAKDTGTTHDATTDTGKSDTGSGVDSGGGDDASNDTGTPDTSTPDTGTPDTGVDAAKDGSTDAAHDTGTDTGTPDTGTDTGTPDTGTDTGTPDTGAPDAGTDASDASTDSGADASDASAISFDNPVQIDVTTVLTANTVVTTTPLPTGVLLTSMDKTGWDFVTNAKAKQKDPTYVGLPDDATFPAVVGVHPFIKLHWNNAVDQLNSRVVQDATPFTFPVTPAVYSRLQVFGVSTEGATTINVVITYSDASTSTGVDLQIADWFNTPTSDQFTVISGMNRIDNGITWDTRMIPGIFGSNVTPDPTKSVASVTIKNTGSGYFVFYGAVGY